MIQIPVSENSKAGSQVSAIKGSPLLHPTLKKQTPAGHMEGTIHVFSNAPAFCLGTGQNVLSSFTASRRWNNKQN